jgi:hypothetical protein
MGDGLLVRVRRRSGGSEPRHRLSFTVHVYRLAPDLPATGSVAPARHWRDKASPPCASMPGTSASDAASPSCSSSCCGPARSVEADGVRPPTRDRFPRLPSGCRSRPDRSRGRVRPACRPADASTSGRVRWVACYTPMRQDALLVRRPTYAGEVGATAAPALRPQLLPRRTALERARPWSD